MSGIRTYAAARLGNCPTRQLPDQATARPGSGRKRDFLALSGVPLATIRVAKKFEKLFNPESDETETIRN